MRHVAASGDRGPLVGRGFDVGLDAGDGGRQVLVGDGDAGAGADGPRVDGEPHLGGAPGRVLGSGDRHAVIRSMRDLAPVRVTWKRTGIRSAIAGTWVMTPTIRSPVAARFSSVAATTSRLVSSRVPNPSSRKIDSSFAAPDAAREETWRLRASASAREAWNVSPPDRVLTGRVESASL